MTRPDSEIDLRVQEIRWGEEFPSTMYICSSLCYNLYICSRIMWGTVYLIHVGKNKALPTYVYVLREQIMERRS
jgi:hypothetical protein